MPILRDDEIYRLSFVAFGDLGPDAVMIFGAICLAESGGNTEAVYDNVAGGWQPAGSQYQFDRGLAQINSVHGFDPVRLLSDPAYNCQCARQIYNLQGFQAWSTFKGGQFEAFMPRMRAAAEAVGNLPVEPPDDFQRGRTEMYAEGWLVVDARQRDERQALEVRQRQEIENLRQLWGVR